MITKNDRAVEQKSVSKAFGGYPLDGSTVEAYRVSQEAPLLLEIERLKSLYKENMLEINNLKCSLKHLFDKSIKYSEQNLMLKTQNVELKGILTGLSKTVTQNISEISDWLSDANIAHTTNETSHD